MTNLQKRLRATNSLRLEDLVHFLGQKHAFQVPYTPNQNVTIAKNRCYQVEVNMGITYEGKYSALHLLGTTLSKDDNGEISACEKDAVERFMRDIKQGDILLVQNGSTDGYRSNNLRDILKATALRCPEEFNEQRLFSYDSEFDYAAELGSKKGAKVMTIGIEHNYYALRYLVKKVGLPTTVSYTRHSVRSYFKEIDLLNHFVFKCLRGTLEVFNPEDFAKIQKSDESYCSTLQKVSPYINSYMSTDIMARTQQTKEMVYVITHTRRLPKILKNIGLLSQINYFFASKSDNTATVERYLGQLMS